MEDTLEEELQMARRVFTENDCPSRLTDEIWETEKGGDGEKAIKQIAALQR